MLNINLMLPNNENVRKYYMGKVQVSGVISDCKASILLI